MSGEQLCLPAKDWHTAATENAVGLGKSRRIMRGFRCTLGISGHPFTIKILILCTLGGALFNSGCVGLVSGSNGGGSPTTLTISNAVTANATPTSIGIDWQTSAPANSQVEYGTTTNYGSTTPIDSTMVTSHQLTVSGLNPGATYHCRVHSTDARNNSAVSGDLPCPTPKDRTQAAVSIPSQAANATLASTANLTASASDNVAVASVQFKVDSANSGAAVTGAPYTYALNTAALSNGNHTLTAVATDTSGNTASSAGVPVSVNNATHAPSIASLNPASGLVGMSVTITGANFGMTQGTSTVTFNGTAATPTSWAATSIVVPVAAGATTGNVVVTVGGVASNGVSFTVTVPPPSITGLNPTSGVLGTSVTITGANFGASQGTSTVTFNGIGATPTSWSVTNIVVPVPAGATTGNLVVTVGGVASNGVSFTVTTPGPSITGLNPTSGLVGTSVTITGANFGATQGTSTVTFNGTAATPTSWSATSIVAPVPSGATTGNVVVTVGGVASNGVSFTVTVPAPSITSLSPTSGIIGTSVTIAGANFGATQGTSTVKFNGTVATPTSWGATSIVAPVPAGATTGNIVVTVGGVASNGASFTVQPDTTPPVVTVTAPANGATVSGTITLTATATDPDSAVSFVQFQVDGANVGAQLTTAPYSLSLNTTTLSNATHSLTAVAQDPSGNVGTSGAVTITVSNATAGLPTLIYSTAVPLAIPSGSSFNGPGSCTTSQNCYRVPLPELTIAGATLTMAFVYNSAGANQVFSVTDDKSNTWTLDTTSSASNSKTVKMYHASNVSAGTSYVNIQITGGTNNDYWQALVAEFFNVGSLDGSSCSAGSSTTISAGSITPTQSGDLIFQAKYSVNTLSSSSPYGLPLQTSSFTPGLQPNITWSLASQLLGDGAADQYGVYNSTVPLNPTFTQAASDSYISCAVALQPAPAGAAPTTIPRVVHQEHDAMPHNAPNPWIVGLVVDVPNSAVYVSRVGNDSVTSISSSPAPDIGWTASGADFNGLNGHNHVNFYCAKWNTPPGAVNLSINRSGTSNDDIKMIYVVQNGTCNLDVDSGGQAANQGSPVTVLTTCSGCITPTKTNDFIMANGGQGYCTATSLSVPSGPSGVFDSAWYTGNTIDGPTQTDENNFWMHFYNGSSLSPITVAFGESCNNPQGDWAGRVAAYQSN